MRDDVRARPRAVALRRACFADLLSVPAVLRPVPVARDARGAAGPAAGLGGHPALAHCAAARSVRCDGRPAVRPAAALACLCGRHVTTA